MVDLKTGKVDVKLIPKAYRKTFEAAYAGKSRVAAVKAKCLECAVFDKKVIKDCDSACCPLVPFRPYQVKKKK